MEIDTRDPWGKGTKDQLWGQERWAGRRKLHKEVKGQGQTRPEINLKAWRRHHFRPIGSSSFSSFYLQLQNNTEFYVDLYSASSRSASNALPLPVSRRWSSQANSTARHQRTLRDHVIRVGVSRDMPVYSPSLRRLGRLRLSRAGCLVPRLMVYPSKDGHPPRH